MGNWNLEEKNQINTKITKDKIEHQERGMDTTNI